MNNRRAPLVVLDVVGLTPRLLAHMPNLQGRRRIRLPGAARHGVAGCHVLGPGQPDHRGAAVANTASSAMAGTSARLARCCCGGSTTRSSAARRCGRRRDRGVPDYTVANVCWWYAMGADVNWTVTPRPVYYADGRKEPDCYTDPPELHDDLTTALGTFPLFNYWGPTAGLASSRWIADAASRVMARHDPDLTLVYLPHLDYDLQRFGPGRSAGGDGRRGFGPDDRYRCWIAPCARRDRRRAVGVRHHAGQPAGARQPHAAGRGPAAGVHAGRHGVLGSVDVAGVRGRRPSGRARLRGRPGRRADRADAVRAVARRRPRARCGGQGSTPVWITRAPANSCWWPTTTHGSRTTTGSTMSAPPISPGSSRSTASPGTTRRSCSSTRPRPAPPGCGPPSHWRARSWACDI